MREYLFLVFFLLFTSIENFDFIYNFKFYNLLNFIICIFWIDVMYLMCVIHHSSLNFIELRNHNFKD